MDNRDIIKDVGDILEYGKSQQDTVTRKTKKKKNTKLIILSCVATGVIITCFATVGVCSMVKRVSVNNSDSNYKEYFEKCVENTVKEEKYTIINYVYSEDTSYCYLDTIDGVNMYSEDSENNDGLYYLTTWTIEDGTTYSIETTDESIQWLKYPEFFNNTALEAKRFDYGLWESGMENIQQVESEVLNLGLDSEVEVAEYQFDIDLDKASDLLSNKTNAVYKALVEEYKEIDEEKYEDIISEYTEHIENIESTYVFSDVIGKIGIYDDKVVMMSISLTGGGTTVNYTKIIAYDEFEERQTPDFDNEIVVELSDYAYTYYESNKTTDGE